MNKYPPPMRAALAAALCWRRLIPVTRLMAAALAGVGLALVAPPALQAQPATGTIIGQVYNPVTREYVRNAEVRVDGTSLIATSEDGGFYRLSNVPAGEVTVTVTYTGYATISETVNVTAGQTATRDFELTAGTRPATQAQPGDTVQLEAYVVSTEREGNAKAIQSQKRNMNVTTSVASDIFGDVTDGNIGEFLKFLPGVDVDYVESETRGPRLGGMDAQYVGVSFDGVRLASADANRTGNLGRATSFEAFSISSVESIEIHRTTSPDMDADSPAGTINLKTRRAFDRKGRRINYNVSLNMNSEEFHFKRTYGPGAHKEYKARPNWSFEYSESFFNNRLGVVLSLNHVDSFTEQYRHNLTYNRTTTSTDPRPMVLTRMNFKDGNKNIEKDTYTVTVDWKPLPNLTLANTFIYNYALGQFFNREINFNSAANNTNANVGRQHVLGDGVTTVRTNGLASNTQRHVGLGGGSASKRTHTATFTTRAEYKWGDWTFDAGGAWSRSFNNYEAFERGHTRVDDVNTITSDWIATRADTRSHEWTIQQVSGPSWFELGNFVNPRVGNEGRKARTEIWTGDTNARWVAPFRLPTVFKFGVKWAEEERNNVNESAANIWRYDGPNGGPTGSWAFLGVNPNFWSTGKPNILTVKDANGAVQPRSIPRPNPNAIAALFNQSPQLFTNIATPDNYFNSFVASHRDIVQTVTAYYGMMDLRLNPKMAIRTGIRWEGTEKEFREFDPKSKAEMQAAGFPLNAAGRATTIPGIAFQYQSNPKIIRRKEYDSFFPMISFKYDITDRLQFHTGFNKAISRPPPDSLTGAWIINEDLMRIISPNPNLLPEYSKNVAARLAYYFEPAGQLSVTVTQNNIRNLRQTRIGTAEEFGLGNDPEFGSYEFQSPFNVDSPVRFRNMELAYSQTFTFLPELWRGTTLTLAYTRSYADVRRGGLSPRRFTSSLGYSYKRFRGRLGVVWRDDTPEGIYGRFRRHDTKFDLGGEFRLTRNASLFFQGRNIFNDSVRWYETPLNQTEGDGAMLRVLENYGANWNFGIKGTF